jgi:hypothetical protein
MESIVLLKLIILEEKRVFSQPDVSRLAISGVEPTPSHYKYNKTFHSAADFP